MGFNPDDFFNTITVKDVAQRFPYLQKQDYSINSLNEELVKLNYEITSPEYIDLLASDIKEYYEFEVDEII